VAGAFPASCELLAGELSRTAQFDAVAALGKEQVQQLLDGLPAAVLLISPGPADDYTSSRGFLRRVRKRYPDLGLIVQIDAADKAAVVEAFRWGAHGVFSRSDSFAMLCKCIVCVHQGQVWASSRNLQYLLETLAQPMAIASGAPLARPLSRREEDVARLAAQGCSNREISERLQLSEHTVKNYLFRVFEKLGVSTRVELTLYTLKGGDLPRTRPPARDPAPVATPEMLEGNRSG